MKRNKVGKTLLLAALAGCLSVSVCHADDYKRENLDEAAFDGQWIVPFNQYMAYIPAELPYVHGSSFMERWELDGTGDEKRAEFSVQDYSTIIELGRGLVEKDKFIGIEEGEDPYYTLAFAALMDDAADTVSEDDFVSINGMPALVYPFASGRQSGVSAYAFDGEKIVTVYLFLRNYEEPEVVIDNVLCSFSTPDYSPDSDSADITDAATATDQEEQKVYTDRETVQKVQEALNNAGFNCGTPDGIAGNNTNQAISSFKSSKGLSGGTEITDELLAALGIAE